MTFHRRPTGHSEHQPSVILLMGTAQKGGLEYVSWLKQLLSETASQSGCFGKHRKQLGPLLTPTSPASEKKKWRDLQNISPPRLATEWTFFACFVLLRGKQCRWKTLNVPGIFTLGRARLGWLQAPSLLPFLQSLLDTTFPWGVKPWQKLQRC